MQLTLPRKAFRRCDLEPGMEPWGLLGGLSYGTMERSLPRIRVAKERKREHPRAAKYSKQELKRVLCLWKWISCGLVGVWVSPQQRPIARMMVQRRIY